MTFGSSNCENNIDNMEASINFPSNILIPVQVFGRERKMRELKAKVVLSLSISQIIIGCLCIVLMSLTMVLDDSCFRSPCLTGYGIQAGVLYCISGVLGCFSARFKTSKSLILFTTIMNILSAAFVIVPLPLGTIDTGYRPNMSLFAIFIIVLALVETAIAITTATFCCKFVCGCNEYYYPSLEIQQFVSSSGRHDIPPSGVVSTSQNLVQYSAVQTREYLLRKYKTNTIKWLAVTQPVTGFLMTLLEILNISIPNVCLKPFYFIGYGIWIGLLYSSTGIVGMYSAKLHPHRKLALSNMILNITSASLSLLVLISAIYDIVIASMADYWNLNVNTDASLIISSLLLIFTSFQIVICIVSASLSCKAICQCCNEFPNYAIFDEKMRRFVFESGVQGPCKTSFEGTFNDDTPTDTVSDQPAPAEDLLNL